VNYTTASGSNIVPDVRHTPPQVAIVELEAAGFSVGAITDLEARDLEELIVSSDPLGGSVAKLGAKVALAVGIAARSNTSTAILWIAVAAAAATAVAAVLWPKLRWSVDFSSVQTRAPENTVPVVGPEISFRIGIIPGEPPAGFSITVNREE
jgi:hypothetical protein